jgi:SAM-dependent methyltransferase
MEKQVNKEHYNFNSYMGKKRWSSIWHQLDEVIKSNPQRVLEIGPGPGVFKAVAGIFGIAIETLDIDPELEPDYVASVFNLPFENDHYDVVCAFQMLEHLPYEKSKIAFREMVRVAKNKVIISLPNADRGWPQTVTVPKFGQLKFVLTKPKLKLKKHVFDGEHHWEINKRGYSLKKVIHEVESAGDIKLQHTFKVHENPDHQFLVFVC